MLIWLNLQHHQQQHQLDPVSKAKLSTHKIILYMNESKNYILYVSVSRRGTMKHELKSWFDCYRVQYILLHLQVILVYQFQQDKKKEIEAFMKFNLLKSFCWFSLIWTFDLKTSIQIELMKSDKEKQMVNLINTL